MDDAVALALHSVLQHLESANSYARILFLDFSSAFNTIVPYQLFEKLQKLKVPDTLCKWTLDFLLNRTQVVKINNMFSAPLTLNTGAPQGCVLSPLLFTLFTNDCVSNHDSVLFLKFSDDTTIEGLIRNSDESAYREEIRAMVDWCDAHNLQLNVQKTKEMIVDFRKKRPL